MKKAMLTLLILLALISLQAFETELQINPFGWQKTVSSADYPVTLEAGKPMVPYVPVWILLPFGHSYQGSEIVLSASSGDIVKVDFALARQQLPISQGHLESDVSSERVFLKDSIYPEKDWEFLGTQYYRGYQIALFNIYPYKYNPVSKQLFISKTARINISSSFDAAEAEYQANFLTPNAESLATLGSLVQNFDMAASYNSADRYRNLKPHSKIIDLGVPKKMIIITNAQRVPWFADYAAWRSSKGVSNSIFSMEDIVANYDGIDAAEKVRNFIIHAYQTWASSSEPLQYVILGGDDEIVPERGAYGQVGDTIDLRMPVDMYYSNLDGNWNANNNTIYGEPSDNTDMIPEVHLGRFPAETQDEFNHMFYKIQYYTDNATYSNNYALFLGENLNMNPVTWGGDYKDDVAQYLPNQYFLQTMYQRDGTYDASGVWNGINSGAGIMNHMGHANEFFLIGQSNGTIENLQNTEYGFLYSQGCYPAAFDQRTSGDSEAIAEHMVTTSGGLHSFIGNTRYGWYMPGSINGASQFYDRQFFRGLFQQNVPELGKALTFSRLQNLNSALSDDVMRWCYYEVVLFGDPSLAVKAFDPSLPLLNLESYTFSDEEGDNDGIINPGEIIRFYPVISNNMNWGTAQNVTLSIESLPIGVTQLSGCLSIPQILPGGLSPLGTHIRLQLPVDMGFGTYNLKIFIESQHPVTGLSTGARRFVASFQITLMDNRFPWETPNAGRSAPLVGNFSNAPGNEILYYDVYGNGYLLDNQGDSSISYTTPAPRSIMRSFAAAAMGSGNDTMLAFASRTGEIYAITHSGTQVFTYQTDTSFLWTPVLADIDGNGELETVAGGLNGMLYAIRQNGTPLPGYPLDLGSAFQSELAAADFDENGTYEIVAGTSAGLLYVIGSGGTVRPGFPVQLNGSITGSPTISQSKKIVCATATKIYIIDPSGAILSTKNIETHIAGGFAMGDVMADNWGMDVVGVSISGKLYAFSDEGNDLPGFPVDTSVNFTCPPLLANLDDDPQLEILLHSYVNSVYGYNHDGSQLSGFPFITTYNGSTPGTLVDFDNNNQTKLILGHANGVLMLNLRRNASQLEPWITYRGSSLRQGSFGSTGFVDSDDNLQTPYQTELKGNYPNPFNPSTTISYSMKKDAHATIEIFNLKGQKVRTLISDMQKAGDHKIVWNGRDNAGRNVASGVYLYRLSTGGTSYQKRMLLLK